MHNRLWMLPVTSASCSVKDYVIECGVICAEMLSDIAVALVVFRVALDVITI